MDDPAGISLRALGWILSDTPRADRFLALTGLTPDSLRGSLGEAATLRAVLDFLCAHEPDLVGAADSMGLEPFALVAARDRLAT